MLLRVPETVGEIAWQGVLESENTDTPWKNIKMARPSSGFSDKLPIVSIGAPEKWNLTALYEAETMPRSIQVKLDEANFYLVRLSCSFRPRRNEVQISQARFIIEILPDRDQSQPIAFDLHPMQVNQEVKHNFKVTLNPSLKFKEVQGSLGSSDFAIEYPELQPTIVATGVGERRPSWEYQKAKGVGIQGSKFMHLLLKVPKNMQKVRAKLKLTADLEVGGNWVTGLFLRNKGGTDSDCYMVDLI